MYSPTKIDNLAPVFKTGGSMANVKSAIERQTMFFSSVDARDHKVIWRLLCFQKSC